MNNRDCLSELKQGTRVRLVRKTNAGYRCSSNAVYAGKSSDGRFVFCLKSITHNLLPVQVLSVKVVSRGE